MPSIKSRWVNQLLEFFKSTTMETVLPVAPVSMYDDFMVLDAYTAADNSAGLWTLKDTAGGSETITADAGNGILALALTAAGEKQEAGITRGDQRQWILNRGLIFEARAAAVVLPTDQAELYFGLAGDYVEGPIAEADAGPAEHMFFCLDGSGAVKIFTDDGTTNNDAIATGVTLTAGTYAIFRIDASDPTSVKFYINGARVAASTTFNMNATPALALQPFAMAHKEAGAGVGTLGIDYIRVWQNRS